MNIPQTRRRERCRRFINSCLFISLLVAGGCNALGKVQSHPPSAKTLTEDAAAITPDPLLVSGTLENGFRYYLYRNSEPRDRVSLHLNVQVGSMHEKEHEQGIAHFIEHMLYNGSTHFKPGALVKYFQGIGMQFGADANAHTGFYETVYDMLLPDGKAAQLEQALMVMGDFAEGALLSPSEIERERKVVLAERRTRDSAEYRTFVKTLAFTLPGTTLAARLPIGQEEILKNANQPLLQTFYRTWYRPEKMVLVMVGDVDPDQAVPLIRKRFGPMKPRLPRQNEPEMGHMAHQGVKSFYHFEEETGSTAVSIERVNIVPHEKDSFAFQKKLLAQRIAGMILQNRLSKMTGKPGNPFTSASTDSGIYYKTIQYASISATSQPEKWEKSLQAIEHALRSALEYGFTPTELNRIKNEFIATLDNSIRAKKTRNSEAIARQIITSINDDRVFLSPEQEKALYSGILDSLTPEAVHQAFKEVWNDDHRLIVVTGNAKIGGKGTTPEAIVLSAFQKSAAMPATMPEREASAVFPYLPKPGVKGTIIERDDLRDLGIVLITFQNGVRLQLKKTDFKANEALFNLAFGNGRSDEPENKPGLSLIAQEVINESGLGRMKKEALEEALAGKSTRIGFNVGDGYFSFQGRTISTEIELLFQLLHANMADPGFRKEAFDLSMEKFNQQYLALSRTVEGRLALKGDAFLTGNDSRFGLPPHHLFRKNTLGDVKRFLEPSFRQDRIELSIVGDFDLDQTIETAAIYLGSLPARTAPLRKRPLTLIPFPGGKSVTDYVETEIPKGMVLVSWLTDEFWYIERTRRLSALGAVFSERLRESVREKMGAAYSPFAHNTPSQVYPFFGLFQAIVPVSPDQGGVVIDEIRNIAANLGTTGVTEEELRLAIDPILTQIKDMRRTNAYWLTSVMTNSWRYPQQLGWSRTIQKDYASITREELTTLAKKYLDFDKAAVIVVTPLRFKNVHGK